MNLSNIYRMVKEGDLSNAALRYLVECHCECEWLDYKEEINLEEDRQLCNFVRDIVAIKNSGGGFIVVGVKDKTWEPMGVKAPLPYDTKMLRDKIRHGSGLDLDVDVVHHKLQVGTDARIFALIYIRGNKKRSKRRTPTPMGKDFCTGKAYGLRRGDFYMRKGDTSVRVQSESDLEDLLDSLESQLDETAFKADTEASPFAVTDGTFRLLEKGFDNFIGRNELRKSVLDSVTRDPRIWIINVHGPGGVGK